MCGIVGIFGDIGDKEKEAFNTLLALDTIRGLDATGVFRVHTETKHTEFVKTTGHPVELYLGKNTHSFFGPGLLPEGNLDLLVGHNRHATRGAKDDPKNAHPYDFDKIIGVHNGTLLYTSDFEIHKHPTDSFAMFNSINERGLAESYKRLRGAAAVAFWNKEDQSLNLFRNNERPLYSITNNDNSLMLFASEARFLALTIYRHLDVKNFNFQTLEQIPVDTHFHYKLDDSGNIVLNKQVLVPAPVSSYVSTPTTYYNTPAVVGFQEQQKNTTIATPPAHAFNPQSSNIVIHPKNNYWSWVSAQNRFVFVDGVTGCWLNLFKNTLGRVVVKLVNSRGEFVETAKNGGLSYRYYPLDPVTSTEDSPESSSQDIETNTDKRRPQILNFNPEKVPSKNSMTRFPFEVSFYNSIGLLGDLPPSKWIPLHFERNRFSLDVYCEEISYHHFSLWIPSALEKHVVRVDDKTNPKNSRYYYTSGILIPDSEIKKLNVPRKDYEVKAEDCALPCLTFSETTSKQEEANKPDFFPFTEEELLARCKLVLDEQYYTIEGDIIFGVDIANLLFKYNECCSSCKKTTTLSSSTYFDIEDFVFFYEGPRSADLCFICDVCSAFQAPSKTTHNIH